MHNGRPYEQWKDRTAGKIEDVIFKYTSVANLNIGSFVDIHKESEGFTIHSIGISDNGINGSFNIAEDLIFDIKISAW